MVGGTEQRYEIGRVDNDTFIDPAGKVPAFASATRGIAAKAKAARIHTASRFSDHAPLIIDYAIGR